MGGYGGADWSSSPPLSSPGPASSSIVEHVYYLSVADYLTGLFFILSGSAFDRRSLPSPSPLLPCRYSTDKSFDMIQRL